MEFRAREAATGRELDPVYRDADPEEIHRTAAAANMPATAGEDRARLLEAIANGLERLGDRLLDRAGLETGLPRARLEGERTRTTSQLRLFASLVREGSWVDARIDRPLPDRKPAPRPDLRRMLLPLGPVAVFGASNFPLAFSVAGGDTAAALAAGNPVVVKAHPAHPGTSDLAAQAVREAVRSTGFPGGVFGMIHGASSEVSLGLVRHPAIKAVAFTGSYAAGRALFDAAGARPDPIPVFAEMSSTNPVFLLEGALRERAESIAAGLVGSCTLGVGQFCTKPGLVFGVATPAWDRFCAEVARLAADVPRGVMLHTGISAGFERALRGIRGVEWLARGGAYVARVGSAVWKATSELAREVFGPYTLLVTARNAQELVDLARSLDGQLTASLHGTDADLGASRELREVLSRRAGRLICNGWPTGVEVSPAMHHGGPHPATTDARFTSVGTASIYRFARPVCWQSFPEALLPPELQDANPLGILRMVDGVPTRDRL